MSEPRYNFCMRWFRENKLAGLMAFHAAWGVVLWLSISKYGLGISTDSAHYLFAGLNLSRGVGLVSFNGSYVSLWPPLYSTLLAIIHLTTGLDIFASANVLQFAAYVIAAFCLSVIFLKVFPDNFLFAFLGNVLSDIGIVVLTTFAVVGSDYVHLSLVMLFVMLTSLYMEHPGPRILLAMSFAGMLTMLDRYLGIAAIATGAVIVFFYTSGRALVRLLRSFLLGLSVLPAMIWFYIVFTRNGAGRAPVSFADNFSTFSQSILAWIFRSPISKTSLPFYITILWIAIGAMIIVLFIFARRCPIFSSGSTPILLYGLIYIIALFGSAAIAYFNKLAGRFLLPVYVPIIALLLLSADALLRCARDHGPVLRRFMPAAAFGMLALISFGLVRNTLPVVVQSFADGAPGDNYFNNRAWNENGVLQYWKENIPRGSYLLFSNDPDAVAFHTMHDVSSSPHKYSGPYGKAVIPLDRYQGQLFSSGKDVYLIWIEPDDYDFLYPVGQLSSIADVRVIFKSKDGAIYQLFPRQENPNSP